MIKGSVPALVTPFKDGALDLVTLKKLVEWHISEGSAGLVPVGTTGESPTLSHEEHQRVIEVVVETAAGRVPVIAGAGSNNTVEGISLIQFAERVGADAAGHATAAKRCDGPEFACANEIVSHVRSIPPVDASGPRTYPSCSDSCGSRRAM